MTSKFDGLKYEGSGKSQRIRIKIGWYMKYPDGSNLDVTDFPNITYKQWDSIGREYLIKKKYYASGIY